MGSHGGATAEGQLEVLASLGVTPESIGCEIRSSMDTVELGEVCPGVPVFIDRNAREGADIVIPINRVKPHTDFRGEIESGLNTADSPTDDQNVYKIFLRYFSFHVSDSFWAGIGSLK